MKIYLTPLLLFIIVFSGCNSSNNLKLGTSLEGAAATRVGQDLADYLNDHSWNIEIIKGKKLFESNIHDQLINNDLNIAFVLNDQAHKSESSEIRTVLPFYPNISYIFYKNHIKPTGLQDLITNHYIAISQEDTSFFNSLFHYYGINRDSISFNLISEVNSVDDYITAINQRNNEVVCVFASVHNPYVEIMLEKNWDIYSLGDIAFTNRGSSVEGFCMNYPRSEPFIVPRNFFGKKPDFPIYTIALNEIMITHKDADERIIYDLVSAIYSGKHFLSQKNILFNYLTEDFDRDALNFPLHQATINYLRRDAPSFFERYAEAFGLIFSVLVVLIGGITSLKKIRKERIDKYYKRIMNCKDINELEAISNEAVTQLQNEKLTADESFTILLNLVEKRRNEISNNPINKR